jgi:oxygen-independent coproporphyrinogen-3 oxidase
MRQIEQGGEQGGAEILDEADLLFEFMLNALRLVDGFSEQLFAERTGLPIPALRERLAPLATRGLVAAGEAGRWVPTPRGQQFLNDLQAHFLPD